ncbi:MAG: glycoside hydrolase family 31 protein [Fusicatenibacter sp.]|nr:glycoside hydrolase family 31 protein [Lachnospiraceae bacterium]MDY2938960.1 glycoside hydrolase family 31 protein [Fusicatenibacter sp.]
MITSRKKQSFGIAVVDLGSPVLTPPTVPVDPAEWEDAVSMNTFYSAGGRRAVSETELQMMWDDRNLYLNVICHEQAQRVLRPSDKDPLKTEWMVRKDRVEIALASGSFKERDYAVFFADSEGHFGARTEMGMTYFGGDKAILNDYFTEKNDAVKTDISPDQYVCSISVKKDFWQAVFVIPWSLFGGLPDSYFRFLAYRKKNQTSEVLSLNPLDLNSNYDSRFDYDPESFIPCALNGTQQVVYAHSACVILPDGTMHWQRPAVLCWPSQNERAEIRELQNAMTPTTPDNLPDRIVTVQRWQDVLMLEGMDFFPNSRCENSFDKVDPWVQRRLCNEALRKGDQIRACREIDVLIGYFRTLTSWWYADHTLGNADEDNWIGFTNLKGVTDLGNKIVLNFEYGLDSCDAVLIPMERGFRFYARKQGDFDCPAVPYTVTKEKESYRIETAHSVITVIPGEQWSVDADGKFILNTDNFRLYDYAGSMGFDVCQPLSVNEMIYGFGERFDAVNQRGKVLSLWHRDAFEGCNCSIGNQSYKNVSLMHSTKGYSLFINSFYRIRADIGRVSSGLRITTAGPKADLYVFTGTPLENLDEYTRITGRPLLPPNWVFEPWAGGGVGRWKDGPTHNVLWEMEGVIKKFKNLDIPHSGLYAEGAGWKWPDHYNKEEVYKIASFAKQEHMKVFSWQFSHISEKEAGELLMECPKEELPITRTPGYKNEKPLPCLIDFSHPLAEELLERQWHDRLDAGFDGTMVDFGEIVPDEAVFFDGRTGDEMHNAYALEYTKAYRKLFEKYRGDDHVLFSRSAAAGVQQYACQFGGDQLSSFRGLTYALNGGLSLAASGFPFWGVDAGGYSGFADEETYLRWTEFAAFCPIMRFHGVTPREPWVYSNYTVGIYKFYAWVRENLLRYSIHTAEEAHQKGTPMMRTLPMMFPGDPEAIWWEDEYFYGPDLLVAPVHQEGTARRVYFPAGRWIDLLDSKKIVDGNRVITVEVPMNRIPVYVREGACIPLEMNGELALGESMTYEKRSTVLMSRSFRLIQGKRFLNGTISEYSASGSEESAEFVLSNLCGAEFLLLLGFDKKPKELELNGQPLLEVPSLAALEHGTGWYQREDLTIAVSVRSFEEIRIHVMI